MDSTRWDADGADARSIDDTAPQPVIVGPHPAPHHHEGSQTHRVSSPGAHMVGGAPVATAHDVVPHHAATSRRGGAVLVAAVVAALLAIGGVAAYAIDRVSTPAAGAAVPSSSASVGGSLTPGASGVPNATGTAAAPMLPAAQDTLVLGDSLGLVVYPWLADDLPDRYVSYAAEVGRSTPNTAKALDNLVAIPPVVIISSGTNDGYAAVVEGSARQMLDKLGPSRCVVWVDVARPDNIGDSASAINAAIDRATAGRPNVRVLRWSDMVAAHPEWMSGDGIHPNDTGAQARAQAYADAAKGCSPLDPSAPTAKKQILPQSIFWGPISGQYSGSTHTSGAGGNGGNGSATSSRTSSPTGGPTSTPSASSTPTKTSGSTAPAPPPPASSNPPPATTSAPPATSAPPVTTAPPAASPSVAGAASST